jgi:hypothetical protein
VTDSPREARALAAARAVALAHGLACEDATVIAAGSNVLVHLKPAPVVARVMVGTAVLHDNVEQWLAREVAVGAFLGARGLAVPPTDLLPPGPHRHDALWMTLWRFVEHDSSGPIPPAHELGRSLRALHDALADFPGELAPFTSVRDGIERLLDQMDPSPSLRSALDELTATVFETPLPAQALHGDISITNLLRTGDGLVWNDLEDVCAGPVEWDVASLVVSARARGQDEAFVAGFLSAYGGAPTLEELAPFISAHDLYTAVWQEFVKQRA